MHYLVAKPLRGPAGVSQTPSTFVGGRFRCSTSLGGISSCQGMEENRWVQRGRHKPISHPAYQERSWIPRSEPSGRPRRPPNEGTKTSPVGGPGGHPKRGPKLKTSQVEEGGRCECESEETIFQGARVGEWDTGLWALDLIHSRGVRAVHSTQSEKGTCQGRPRVAHLGNNCEGNTCEVVNETTAV